MRLMEDCPRAFTLTLLHLIVGPREKRKEQVSKTMRKSMNIPLKGPEMSETRGRTASWLHRVDACLDWLTVEGGSCLYRQGEELSGFFTVLPLDVL